MYTISRSELPSDMFLFISEIQRLGVWRILELKSDHVIFYSKGRFMVMVPRKLDVLFETFRSREGASDFVLGVLV